MSQDNIPPQNEHPLAQDASQSPDGNDIPRATVDPKTGNEKQIKWLDAILILTLILIMLLFTIRAVQKIYPFIYILGVFEELTQALTICATIIFAIKYSPKFFNTGKTFVSVTATNGSIANVTSDEYRPPQNTQGIDPKDIGQYNSFPEYFETMRLALITRINHASRQSELLMDQGIMMAYKGIGLYIAFIIIWQVIPMYTEIKQQYYFGYASSTALFLFMEFLAAWSLKQYRNYVEISTYLLKVKSTLDRYILTYLAQKDASGSIADSKLIELLSKDLTWPDTFLNKHPDVSFAKECLETSTLLVRSLKGNAKDA